MSGPLRHPPGRAGRLWLQRRLATAQRGARLLDLQLRLLRREQTRYDELARRTGLLWEQRLAEAERWYLRAAAVAGARGLRPGAQAEPAQVDVAWAAVMGVRYPSAATCRPASAGPDEVAASAAIPLAAQAYRAALAAAVEHAAAAAAARVVAAEVRTTGVRLRAVQERWLPRLEAELHVLELGLDELERGDAVRRRWAAGRQEGRP